ncbi:hypothetical protein Gorai_000191, partial [Gossypium raimondii]|nr:hypothetical protein [Gossypium raimondii]
EAESTTHASRDYFFAKQGLSSVLRHTPPTVVTHWSPLPPLQVKVNVDTSYSEPRDQFSLEFIIWNDMGKIMGSGLLCPYLGSYNLYGGGDGDYSALRPIIWDVKSLLKGFKFCRFKFVPRGCNTAAHAMVALGWKGSTDRFWVEDVPLGVWEVVTKDWR